MPKLTIDGKEIEVPNGYTVLQAAQMLETEVPVFCYHPRLPIAGNCRMCLVEMEKSPKLIASCAMPAAEGMVIHTQNEKVQKARQGVLEFLLINHPLDCPICDQGGECDLQDITMAYGPSTSRYEDNKRAVPEKPLGPLIKTFMNRCIHCTRCIRFATTVAGVPELGAAGRGEHMEILSYVDQAVASELSGNLVDVCPVGALTSKPYQFLKRSWELEKTDSIDVHDAVGSNIRIGTYGLKVWRILPRLHEGINEEWLSDKSRHACDGLAVQRLDRPYLKRGKKLEVCSWEEALEATHKLLKKSSPAKTAVLVGDLVDAETIGMLRRLTDTLKIPHRDCRLDGVMHPAAVRSHYLFNTTIQGIENADACLIIGANVRADASLIHARLRKRYLQGNFKVAYVGGALPSERDLTFDYTNLGPDPEVLNQILAGKHDFSKVLEGAKNPMIILGNAALKRTDGTEFLKMALTLADTYKMVRPDWNGFNVLHTVASRVGGLDLGFVPAEKGLSSTEVIQACQRGEVETLYLIGIDDLPFDTFKNVSIIYQGHHGDAGAHHADVILPGAAYTEKDALYVNTEGRVQEAFAALPPPGQAKTDWEIVKAIAQELDLETLPQTLDEVRALLGQLNPVFHTRDTLIAAPWEASPGKGSLDKTPFDPEVFHFYQRDVISRHSKTMAACVQELMTPSAEPSRRTA
jgi:NADH-quinone oxidoreductase subunit G